jgi:hypothetical protein
MISFQKHTKESLKERVFYNQPASPVDVCPYKRFIIPCPPGKLWYSLPQKEKK